MKDKCETGDLDEFVLRSTPSIGLCGESSEDWTINGASDGSKHLMRIDA